MKSKRFTTLIAIFAMLLLTCTAAFGLTVASADGTAGDYFTVSNGSMSIEGDVIVFDVNASAVVTTKNDLFLPETAIDYSAENLNVKINGEEYASGTTIGGEAGKLEIELELISASAAGKFIINNIQTAGHLLYSIQSGEIVPNEQAVHVYDASFKFLQFDAVVWGYTYEDVDFEAYHGFVKDIKKQVMIAYAEDAAAADAMVNAYLADGTKDENLVIVEDDVKFTSYNTDEFGNPVPGKKFIKAYWGVVAEEQTIANYSQMQLNVRNVIPDEAPAYENLDQFMANDLEGYMEEVEAETKNNDKWKYIGSSSYFNVPTGIYDYITSKYFSQDDLTYVIYYKLPGSDDFTKLSSTSKDKRFSLSKLGEYEYYVLATDPQNNALELDEEWTLKVIGGKYGFYDDADVLQVPVFKFYLGNSGPQVTSTDSYQEVGYVGSVYTKVDKFTTKGNDLTITYTLWYNSTPEADKFDATSEAWVEIGTKEAFEAVQSTYGWTEEDYATLAWDASSLKFTPIEIGSYAVQCTVSDCNANTATAATEVISVNSKMSKVEINNTRVWFERNWKSVVFLGIAALSLAGIIALLFVKPKEEKELGE